MVEITFNEYQAGFCVVLQRIACECIFIAKPFHFPVKMSNIGINKIFSDNAGKRIGTIHYFPMIIIITDICIHVII